MNYCENCGAPLDDQVKFCGKCGKETVKKEEELTPKAETTSPINLKGQLSKSKISPKLLSLIGLAVIVLLISVTVIKNEKKKVDLNQYVSLQFEGFDSIGSATANIDESNFEKAVLKAQGKSVSKSMNSEDFLEALKSDYTNYELQDSINMDITPSEGLKNGDKVTLKITFDDKIAKEHGIKFIAKEQTFTVDGLQAVQEIDPFKDFEVSFDGIAPNSSVSWKGDYTNDFLYSVDFDADKTDNINAGDVITITADIDANEALKQGYKLTQTSKQFTCEDVDTYITKCSDISNDTLSSMQTEALDHLDAYFARNATLISNSDLTFEGTYLLMSKSSSGWNDNNLAYLIYSTTVSSLDETFEPTVVYIPVQFGNLIKESSGSQTVELNSPNIIGDTDLSLGWFSYVPGYTDTSVMYNEIITSNKGNYTYDISESLQKFSN